MDHCPERAMLAPRQCLPCRCASTPNGEQSQVEVEEVAPAVELKPWLITPTLSADPKLGTNVGGLIAYLKKLDAESTPSMTGLSVSYSDTDSMTGALFSQLYWKADSRRLSLLAAGAEVNNEYDDFLGTGQTVKTQDNVHTFGFRYLHKSPLVRVQGVRVWRRRHFVAEPDWIIGLRRGRFGACVSARHHGQPARPLLRASAHAAQLCLPRNVDVG